MKKVMFAFVLLVCIFAGVVYYFYNKVSYQPSWYREGETHGQPLRIEGADKLIEQIKQDLFNGKKVTLPVSSLVPLAISQIQAETGLGFEKAIKAAKTTVTEGGIEVELMVDVLLLPADTLPKEAHKVFDDVIKKIPVGALKDLYVRCRLKPVMQKDVFSLDPTSGLSVGKLELPLDKLEEMLGQKARIPLDKFPVSDFKLSKDALELIPKIKAKP